MRLIKPATLYSRFDSDKKLFMFMLVVIVVITVDSQIGIVADFIPEQISSRSGVSIFIVIAVIFAVTQYLILNCVKQLNKETKDRMSHFQLLQTGASVGQGRTSSCDSSCYITDCIHT